MPTTLSVSPSIRLSDIAIRQDADGRYCINDLHKAAGEENRHKPNLWLSNQQTIDLAKEVEIAGFPAIVAKQGLGTYVVKELVYAYAMWISASFHLQVIRTFDAQVSQSPDAPLAALKISRLAMQAAKAFGFKGNQAVLSADNAVRAITGQSVLALMGRTAVEAEDRETLLVVTEIADRLGSPLRSINPKLTESGLQTEYRDHKNKLCYELTETGHSFGVYVDTSKKHGDGSPVRQIKWRASVVEFLARQCRRVNDEE